MPEEARRLIAPGGWRRTGHLLAVASAGGQADAARRSAARRDLAGGRRRRRRRTLRYHIHGRAADRRRLDQ